MIKKYFISSAAAVLLLITGCSDKESETTENTSVETLQQKNGYPVRITNIKREDLTKWDEYTGTLSGSEEVSVFGLLGDNYSEVNVEVGDIVKKNDVLAEFPSNNPQANYNQAKIGLETAKKTYERMKRVYRSGGISEQQLDEIEAQYKIARENFNATKQLIKVISPVSGVVADVFFDKGDKNDPGRPFCKIIKTSKLKTTIFIEEEKIKNYEKGQEVRIKWDGLKDKEFKGVINKISMSSNPAARGFSVEVSVNNEHNELMPGIFVYVYTKIYGSPVAIAVPRDAIFTEGGKNYVYLA
ncbi:MAG: efflux RND transporter periplasmic adaptor subunit, partial [Candidatus Delongbacteria bacterium]